ncbi:uncharacterized protein K460DRAFT_392640 [Cucurbitaria berberidis CBS 394.84]|uniref:MYND-type domain-containing protein n=1 Tax=Cucurbitaria berberidis CBS 394.84 TaxID=1168544 RepID=A0A9P4GKQ5_9PLEO|nr:uncharacterized protein K460DRAFT_392640 [Cucurbitaria berberidis CBS 394.84]KAF1847229.1 hypothetical protein K460DRAFT_392640 [Cucurbitaria berberidis CBS 394.84]
MTEVIGCNTRDTPLQRCSGCDKLWYCSKACQTRHWTIVHKYYCKGRRGPNANTSNKDWPEQQMPARVYPHNTHLSINLKAMVVENHIARSDGSGSGKDILLNQDEATTYKLLIESFRVWDETKRYSLGLIEDPRMSYYNASVKHCTGYLFEGLMKHIENAEKMPEILPVWWDQKKRGDCVKTAREMYHWDDLNAGVPAEVNEWNRYGGPCLRLPLRLLGMRIEGMSQFEAVLMGYLQVSGAGTPNQLFHAMSMV